jgi:hypothetical protein
VIAIFAISCFSCKRLILCEPLKILSFKKNATAYSSGACGSPQKQHFYFVIAAAVKGKFSSFISSPYSLMTKNT